ncbi:MAG: PGPGW domain-containing protein [Planctomycetota bacterium]
MDEPETPPTPQTPAPRSWPFRWFWQVVVLIAGIFTIAVGVILLPLPGPGSLVIVAGIGILSTEFIWAKYALMRIRNWVKRMLVRIRAWYTQRKRRPKQSEKTGGPAKP